jgi:hypothetical protein
MTNKISNMLCDERYSNHAHRKQNEMKHETRKFQKIDKIKIKIGCYIENI